MNNKGPEFTFPYIEGDGIGQDITPASIKIGDAAWKKIYGEDAQIKRLKLAAGQESVKATGEGLPQETLDAIRKYGLAMKGPMETAVGGGNRSYNVALRKALDLYACIRPLKYFEGVPSSHITPRGINAVLFRENVEDVYSGHEFEADSEEAKELIAFLKNKLGVVLEEGTAIGLKNISKKGSKRLIKAAAKYAKKYGYDSLSMMHKGNIMKYTEGAFMNRGYELLGDEYSDDFITKEALWIMQNHKKGMSIEENTYAMNSGKYDLYSEEQKKALQSTIQTIIDTHSVDDSRESKKVVSDIIADNMLQQTFLNPHQFGVIAATNLNGDYESDAFAGVIGGLGVSPGANVNIEEDIVVVEATHGTAPDLGRDMANNLSHTLSMKMGFELKGHQAVGKVIEKAIAEQLMSGRVTGDLVNTAKRTYAKVLEQHAKNPKTPGINHLLEYAREQKDSLTMLSTSEFTQEICARIAA